LKLSFCRNRKNQEGNQVSLPGGELIFSKVIRDVSSPHCQKSSSLFWSAKKVGGVGGGNFGEPYGDGDDVSPVFDKKRLT